jgi:hypothetical protein
LGECYNSFIVMELFLMSLIDININL